MCDTRSHRPLLRPPITILIEGSAFVQNIDAINKKISARNNPHDRVLLIDISPTAIASHQDRVNSLRTKEKYSVTWGDMNDLRLGDKTADMVINDCAINFNTLDGQNKKTISEIKRVMKPQNAICLFSTVVPRKFDSSFYGLDQELVPKGQLDKSVDFYPLTFANPSTAISRKCWPLPYYKSLLHKAGFSFHKFDDQRGKTYFPEASQISYRRFLLTLK